MYLNEDKLIEWLDFKNAYLITRKQLKTEIDFTKTELVCLTGYPRILQNFFINTINKFSKQVVVIIIESDIIYLKEEWLNHNKLKCCFTWNKPFEHSKLKALPIGLNYKRQYSSIEEWLKNNKYLQVDNNNLLCFNCSLDTNQERKQIKELVSRKWYEYCNNIPYIKPIKQYKCHSYIENKIKISVCDPEIYSTIKKYKFIISPKGAGIDCHRTWESLIIGCIPIVLSSSINELYDDLPVVVVDNWNKITKDFLNKKYEEIQENIYNNKYNFDKLKLHYWINQIKQYIQAEKEEQQIHFITYGNYKYKTQMSSLIKQAYEFNDFSYIRGFQPNDLPYDFIEKYNSILKQNRGGGYWIWKIPILIETFSKIKENDILLYMDAGSTLNKKGKKRFYEYINMLNNSDTGILSIQMSGNKGPGSLCKEKEWTIKQIFDYFNVSLDSELAYSGQLLGGIFMLKKNKNSNKYINKLKQVLQDNPLLFTDYYNRQKQHPEFKDNRHDQSISSILRKQIGTIIIDGDETYMKPFGKNESLKYPFWATRHRK